jgi:murein DD-endopeptidase MepM/ murein hydrolase activator NlpD
MPAAPSRAVLCAVALSAALSAGAATATGIAHGATGGAPYVPPNPAGGADTRTAIGPLDVRPIVASLAVAPGRVRTGKLPEVRFRVRQRGVRSVRARLLVYRAATRRTARRTALDVALGEVAVGHETAVRWPRSAVLGAGRYVVSLHATDPTGRTLARTPGRRGQAVLRVLPLPAPTPPPAPAPAAPTTPMTSGVFPVAGPHGFGGEDARFGAGRAGHVHQGQDVTAAQGTPVVAPEAGMVIAVDEQPAGAGFYVTLHGASGRDLFFAHLQRGSTAVLLGQSVAAGALLGRVGMTGSATGPHLHVELWEGGWQRGRPIDPLPQLQAWEATSR